MYVSTIQLCINTLHTLLRLAIQCTAGKHGGLVD